MKRTHVKRNNACAHADASGRCANPESNGQGSACRGCEDFREKVMGKREEVTGASRACGHAGRDGKCLRPEAFYIMCVGLKCKDHPENAQRSTPNAQLSTEGEGYERDHGVQEAGGEVQGGGVGGAVADARRVAPERGRELERGVRDAGPEAEAGEKGDGVPVGGRVVVAGGGVRPAHAAGEADREPAPAGALVRLGGGGVPLGGRGGEDERLKSEVRGKREEVTSPSQACACAREGGELPDVTREVIARCYLDAVCGALHVIRFGCMMLVKETVLKVKNGAKTDDPGYDGGLRAWLQANLPDVNYKTAMGFKGTAGKLCEVLGVSSWVMLRALNPDPKALPDEPDCDALIAVRDRLSDIIAGRNSLYAIRLWLTGHVPDTLADGKASEETGTADELALDAAKKFGRVASDALKCLDGRQRSAMTKALAGALREALGLKGLAWLAKVLEEAEG